MYQDLLVIGNLTLDTVYEVDRIPSLDETGLVSSSNVYFGGRAGNIAVNGARLGLEVAIASIVGDDFVESGYRDYLLAHRVNIDKVKILKTRKCPEIQVYKKPDGEHVYFFQPNALKHYKTLDLKIEDLSRFKVIYLTSFNSEVLITQLMTRIERFDNIFFGFGEEIYRKSRNFLELAIKISSYMNLNAAELGILYRKMKISSIAEIFNTGKRLKFFCVSSGGGGSVIYKPNSKCVISATPPVKFVSTLGAGDAYVAGLIFGIMNKWSVEDCGRLGSVLSSFILEGDGAQNVLPQWKDIRNRSEHVFGKLPSQQQVR